MQKTLYRRFNEPSAWGSTHDAAELSELTRQYGADESLSGENIRSYSEQSVA